METQEILDKLREKPPERRFSLGRAKVNKEERSVALAFSSEEPVVRWYGIEVLSHEPGAMRMRRVGEDGLPLLFNHDMDVLLGRLNDVRVDDDRVGRGTAVFDKDDDGAKRFRQVEGGILRDVSVRYEVHFMREVPAKELPKDLMEVSAREKAPVYYITDWEPVEVSLVTVPADPTVGVGRTAGGVVRETGPVSDAVAQAAARGGPPKGEQQWIEANIEAPSGASIISVEEKKMSEEKKEKTIVEIEADMDAQRKKAACEAREAERLRVQGINDIYERFKTHVPEFMRRKAVDEGTPLQDFQDIVLKRLSDAPGPIETPDTDLGLSSRELKQYSVSRAILSQWKESGVKDGIEMECHRELQKRGIEAKRAGILVPYDIMKKPTAARQLGQRDLSLGTDAAGAYLRGTDHLGSEFIDVLYNAMVLRRAGARVLSGLRGNVNIPKRTAGVTAYWVAEGSAPTEGANTFGQASLSPNNVAANIDYTRNLLLQSNPSIDALVNGDMAESIAGAIDLAGFHGAGTDEPQGIVGTGSVGATTATSVTFAKMLDFQTDLATANCLVPGCAYITTPAVAAILAALAKFTYGTKALWEGSILESSDVCGFRGFASGNISSGYMIFGDFSQVLIGEWGTLELVVDPYTQSKNGIIAVTAFKSADIALRRPAAFSVSTSVTAPN